MRVILYSCNSRRHQSGLVVAIVTLAMFSLIGIAALAIDVNHALMNKNRLQNSVDSAALAAAIVLDNHGSEAMAKTVATDTLAKMALADGNSEMAFNDDGIEVQFSNDAKDFSGTYDSSHLGFVRVAVTDYPLYGFFTSIFGITKNIKASAVAGPSPASGISNVVPMAVCAGYGGSGTNYGYESATIYALKLPSKTNKNSDEAVSMGPGNFQLLDLSSVTDTQGNSTSDGSTNSGAAAVRAGLAGSFSGSVVIGGTVDTKPGASIGPVGQGLNTRLNIDDDDDYPPDQYVKEPEKKATLNASGNVDYKDDWYYADYLSELPECFGASADPALCPVDGQPNRRILPVPIVDCTSGVNDSENGKTTYKITAIGCFFMLQKAPTSGGGDSAVFGEFIDKCEVNGGLPGTNSNSDGPYRIVLYKDPYSEDS